MMFSGVLWSFFCALMESGKNKRSENGTKFCHQYFETVLSLPVNKALKIIMLTVCSQGFDTTYL